MYNGGRVSNKERWHPAYLFVIAQETNISYILRQNMHKLMQHITQSPLLVNSKRVIMNNESRDMKFKLVMMLELCTTVINRPINAGTVFGAHLWFPEPKTISST